MSNDKLAKSTLSPKLMKYSEFSAEDLGTYILNYLKNLKGNATLEKDEIHDKNSLRELILHLLEKVKNMPSNTMRSSKLRRDLEFQFDVIARNFNDLFFPSPPPAPRQKIEITSERGRLTPTDDNCIQCSMKLNQGWRFHTNVGDIYFCTLCKEKFFRTGNFKEVNPWSRMIFSAFETNRKKH